MLWEALGSVILGLALAGAAARWLPGRFPHRPLLLATGPVAALLGGLITRVVTGPGHPVAVLTVAAAVCVALLSLLHGGGSRSPQVRHTGVAAPPPAH
ncbi:hypothetical protein [Streptomyces sp. JJ36]|uniref:hypothetical protein n=1 Tax=Streptomyces sp. JJ36 TaxID=2736645 RepID=UPI001F459F47|nr:hypothetical protein [Streptomyces sp. JJ36]